MRVHMMVASPRRAWPVTETSKLKSMQKWETCYKGAGESGRVIHFEGALGAGLALCGADLDGDSALYDKQPRLMDNGKVTCPQCISVVEHVRRIRDSEMKK
jgi:hypothetical protein